MELTAILAQVAQVLWLILLVILILAVWELFRILRDVAHISKRLELLTDVAGWLKFFRKFQKNRA